MIFIDKLSYCLLSFSIYFKRFNVAVNLFKLGYVSMLNNKFDIKAVKISFSSYCFS